MITYKTNFDENKRSYFLIKEKKTLLNIWKFLQSEFFLFFFASLENSFVKYKKNTTLEMSMF